VIARTVRQAAGAAALALSVLSVRAVHGAHAVGSNKQWDSVEFSMKPKDSGAHSWMIHLNTSGSGDYTEVSDEGTGPVPLSVSQATFDRIRRGEHAVKSGHCETRMKNIAQTGEKTIRYHSADHDATCTFNYSDDDGLMDSFAAFQAVAETIQAGERLQHDQRYARLALDADMENFLGEVHNGSAIEVGNIAPILQSLVADEHIIDRVRRNAARLLQDSGLAAPAEEAAPSER
jgi:hypothetical protein